MQAFTYKYGDRPLEGYTIQRAAGRGGFGEVYYALSDSGREVALKVVQGYEEIELRGISQCMNLKSPHLVTIFDVKHNEQGKPFVIMEYVAGPSLRELIDEAPAGLGTQKAAFFLREIAKGLTYLHDRGIVHRDLKPGNIFYEDGYVKIGDYGLSKAISASKHSGQTITVGTVHYMAPEIGEGRYDRGIDIYALGCMLYEMLTGQTPYLGGSPGEILMKHLTQQPDLSGIEEPFAGAIRKALAKDPKDRFQTVQEMVEAVFGAAHIQQSVSCFSPDSLTMVAGRVAQKVTAGGAGSSGQIDLGAAAAGAGGPAGGAAPQPGERGDRLAQRFERLGERIGKVSERIGDKLDAAGARLEKNLERAAQRMEQRFGQKQEGAAPVVPPPVAPPEPAVDPKRDPLTMKARVILFLLTAAVIGGGTSLFSTQDWGGQFPLAWYACFMAICGAAGGVLLAYRWLEPSLRRESALMSKLAHAGLGCTLGGLLAFCALLAANGVPSRIMSEQYVRGTALSIAIALFVMNWSKMIAFDRRERIALGPVLKAALLGLILCGMFEGNLPFVIGTLAGIALAVQARSPFDPLAIRGPKRPRKVKFEGELEFGEDAPDRRQRSEQRAQRRQERHEARMRRWEARWQTDSWRGPLGADGYPLLPPGVSPRKRTIALILAAGWFMGFGGLQRFYVGRYATGLLWLMTGGGLVIGQIIDVIRILTGTFTDRYGRRLVIWDDYGEFAHDRQGDPSGWQGSPSAGRQQEPMPPAAVAVPIGADVARRSRRPCRPRLLRGIGMRGIRRCRRGPTARTRCWRGWAAC